nr:polysaccharide deacetylase family protein [Thermoleophilaceae bacterium]
NTERRRVALSFDDGPDPRWTPRVLRVLAAHRARATFFLTGARAIANPAIVRAQIAQRHEIGNHGYTHPNMRRLSPDGLRRQVEGGATAIVRSGAPQPRLFRAPYGSFNEQVGAAAARSGAVMVNWDRPLDPLIREHGPGRAAHIAMRHMTPGSIVLAHDGTLHPRQTLRTVARLLRGLHRRGYEVVPVGELLGLNQHLPVFARDFGLPLNVGA